MQSSPLSKVLNKSGPCLNKELNTKTKQDSSGDLILAPIFTRETIGTNALFFTACSVFLIYPDDVRGALENIRGLVILDYYFSGRVETIST